MRIILGIVIMIVGVLMVKHVEVVAEAFGPSAFAQKYFGSGSDSFYKFLGVLVIIIGMLLTTGLLGDILLALLVPLFRGFAPQ